MSHLLWEKGKGERLESRNSFTFGLAEMSMGKELQEP